MNRPASWEDVVWQAKPELAKLAKDYGDISILEYFEATAAASPRLPREKDFLDVIGEEAGRLLGREAARATLETLSRQWMVSTADHHGPLSHPFFLNANLVQALANGAKGLQAVVVLACGGISLNNSSFPRGLLSHDSLGGEERVHFISLKHKHHPVFGSPAYQEKDIAEADFSSESLRDLVEGTFLTPKSMKMSFYSDQASLGNYLLWKRMPANAGTELIYLEQEFIVAKLLVERHLFQDTTVSKILLDPSWRRSFLRFFSGVQGAFGTSRGTVFFWGIRNGERTRFVVEDDRLVAPGKDWEIPLQPELLQAALEKKEIFPSMALTFIVLAFYYGLDCGGGFSQVNYLGEMKAAWLNLLEELDADEEEKEIAKNARTNIFRGEFVLASMALAGRPVPATSVDLVLRQGSGTEDLLRYVARKLSVRDALRTMMPEYHKIITGHYPKGATPFFPPPVLEG